MLKKQGQENRSYFWKAWSAVTCFSRRWHTHSKSATPDTCQTNWCHCSKGTNFSSASWQNLQCPVVSQSVATPIISCDQNITNQLSRLRSIIGLQKFALFQHPKVSAHCSAFRHYLRCETLKWEFYSSAHSNFPVPVKHWHSDSAPVLHV